MDANKSYFLMEMADEDYFILLSLCRRMNMSKQQFIMEALKTHIQKLQDEWRATLSKPAVEERGGEK